MQIVDTDTYNQLGKVFRHSNDYKERVRSHVLILFEKGFSVNSIRNIYDISTNEISIYLRYLDFFGINDYLDQDLKELSRRVEEEEYRLEQIRLRKLKNSRSIFYYLFYPFRIIARFIYNISTMLMVLFAYLISTFLSKRQGDEEISNIANIEKGSSNNYIIQIGTLTVNKEVVDSEYLVTESKKELIEKVEELIESGKKYDFNNDRANSLFDRAQKEYSEESQSNRKSDSSVKLYAVLIVGVLIYSTTFKGGLSTISIFGIVVVVSVRSCLPSYNAPNLDIISPTIIGVDTNRVEEIKVDEIELDSLRLTGTEPIVTIEEYMREIPNWFDYDVNCLALSAMGKDQRNFISNYDRVDHFSQSYYIDSYDRKYYLHVVAYSNIKEAAFQMEFIKNNTDFRPKILEVTQGSRILYAVVIGQFEGNEIAKTCEMVESWNIECITGSNEIGYIYNGN